MLGATVIKCISRPAVASHGSPYERDLRRAIQHSVYSCYEPFDVADTCYNRTLYPGSGVSGQWEREGASHSPPCLPTHISENLRVQLSPPVWAPEPALLKRLVQRCDGAVEPATIPHAVYWFPSPPLGRIWPATPKETIELETFQVREGRGKIRGSGGGRTREAETETETETERQREREGERGGWGRGEGA
jgi:hypothetical protein